ncbi:hypothetical protein LXL04_030869 [Taraxacum kok-saghyz]
MRQRTCYRHKEHQSTNKDKHQKHSRLIIIDHLVDNTARYGRCVSPAVRGLEEGHVGWSAPLWKEEGDSREFRIGHRRGHAAGERRWRRLPLCSPAPSFLPAVNINTSDAAGNNVSVFDIKRLISSLKSEATREIGLLQTSDLKKLPLSSRTAIRLNEKIRGQQTADKSPTDYRGQQPHAVEEEDDGKDFTSVNSSVVGGSGSPETEISSVVGDSDFAGVGDLISGSWFVSIKDEKVWVLKEFVEEEDELNLQVLKTIFTILYKIFEISGMTLLGVHTSTCSRLTPSLDTICPLEKSRMRSPPSELLFQASVMEVRRWQNSPERSRAGRYACEGSIISHATKVGSFNSLASPFPFVLMPASNSSKILNPSPFLPV